MQIKLIHVPLRKLGALHAHQVLLWFVHKPHPTGRHFALITSVTLQTQNSNEDLESRFSSCWPQHSPASHATWQCYFYASESEGSLHKSSRFLSACFVLTHMLLGKTAKRSPDHDYSKPSTFNYEVLMIRPSKKMVHLVGIGSNYQFFEASLNHTFISS